MDLPRDLGEALKRLRKDRGWTQLQLAGALRKTETTVRRWEIGIHEPPKEVFEKLAGMCEGKLSQFFAQKAGVPGRHQSGPVAETLDAIIEQLRALSAQAESGDTRAAVDLQHIAGALTERARRAANLAKQDEKKIDEAEGGEYSASFRTRDIRREKGKVRMALTLQVAPDDEQYYRMLERIFASKDKGAIESIKSNLDTFVRLAKLTDKRLAEEERIPREAPRRA